MLKNVSISRADYGQQLKVLMKQRLKIDEIGMFSVNVEMRKN